MVQKARPPLGLLAGWAGSAGLRGGHISPASCSTSGVGAGSPASSPGARAVLQRMVAPSSFLVKAEEHQIELERGISTRYQLSL